MGQQRNAGASRRLPRELEEDPLYLKLTKALNDQPFISESPFEDGYFKAMAGLEKIKRDELKRKKRFEIEQKMKKGNAAKRYKPKLAKWQFYLTKQIWDLLRKRGLKRSALAQYTAKGSPCLDDGAFIGKSTLTECLNVSTHGKPLQTMSINSLLLCSEFFDVSTDYLLGKTDLEKQRASWESQGVFLSKDAFDTLRRSERTQSLVDFLLRQPEIMEVANEIHHHIEISAICRYVFSSYSDEVRDLLLRAFEKYWETHVSPMDWRSYALNIEDMLQGNGAYDLGRIVREGIGDGTRDKIEKNIGTLEERLQGEELLYRCVSLALAEETLKPLEYKTLQVMEINNWKHDLFKMIDKYISEETKERLDGLKDQIEQEEQEELGGRTHAWDEGMG